MSKKLLITGFDPFGGESINPSWEAVALLPDVIGAWELTKLQIPTVFEKAAEQALSAAVEIQPDVVLCIGQAGGRPSITPEFAALNIRSASIPDNEGGVPVDVPVVAGGPAGLFSTIPCRAIVESIKAAGISAAVSYHAGTFVCNDLLYTLLWNFRNTTTRVGFIHVPFLPQQTGEGKPCMTLEDICLGLETAIRSL